MRKLTDLTEIASALGEIVDIADRMKNAYVRFPPSSARERRRMEQRNTAELISFEFDGHLYEAAYDTMCSVKNVYAHGYYTIDGSKVTLRQVRACLNKIRAELEGGDHM